MENKCVIDVYWTLAMTKERREAIPSLNDRFEIRNQQKEHKSESYMQELWHAG